MINNLTTERALIFPSDIAIYWICDNDVYLAPVTFEMYCVNDTRLKIKFDKGHIFGVQFIPVSDIGKPLLFEHFDESYKIIICKRYTSKQEEEAIRQKLL